MKSIIFRTLCAFLFLATCAAAQETIPLYPGDGTPPNSTPENYPEKAYFSKLWNTDVVSNVTKPSMIVFKPSVATKNGTAAVICPGGGFMALSISSEGTDVAKYLTEHGITTFVLKYRLAHTGEDATQDFADAFGDHDKFRDIVAKVIPQSIADGVYALAYVRHHAADYGVSPDKIGIIGFSAGGTVAVGATLRDAPGASPAFLGSIYAATSMFKDRPFPEMRRPSSSPPPPTTTSASPPTASPSTKNGSTPTNPPSSTCTPKAATASAPANTTSPPITGSTVSPSGSNSKAS